MLLKKQGALSFLQFELLSDIPGFVHGVFLRSGGVSHAPFHSLNVGFGTGDVVESVQENRRRIKEVISCSTLLSMNQVHGNEIFFVENKNPLFSSCDGLMTGEKDIGLMALHADCQVAIFYDPIHKGLSVVHAGWRGQVQNIYKNCIQKMGAQFGTNPKDVLIGISPSLGPSRAEFCNYKTELPEEFWPFQNASHYFNLWEIARYQLELCGVLSHHIQIAQICTCSHPVDYFSYRRDKTTGRNATVAALF